MFCPHCGLVITPDAEICDCGYQFHSGARPPDANNARAGLGERMAAQTIDSAIPFVALAVSLAFAGITHLVLFGVLLFGVFYLLFAGGFSGGQSWGKRIVGTAVVVERTGEPCGLMKSLVRNLPLVVVDWLFIFGEDRQRLGDKIAGTVVVRRR
jgi:uncharacterized RDD family membrane protein YckC